MRTGLLYKEPGCRIGGMYILYRERKEHVSDEQYQS